MSGEVERHRREIERLHEGMVVELDRRFTGRGERAGAPPKGRNDPAIDEEVASTISVIRQVASVIGELQETIRRQEELIYEQRQNLSELQHQNQTVYAELAEVERAAKAERERADQAESRAQSGDAQIKRLEDYSVSLKSHLNSLMAVVRDSLAVPDTATRSA
jgi:chromosome segregation ATPase